MKGLSECKSEAGRIAGTSYAGSASVVMSPAVPGESGLQTSSTAMVSPSAVDARQIFAHGSARTKAKRTAVAMALDMSKFIRWRLMSQPEVII
jgi:hypothetical protein